MAKKKAAPKRSAAPKPSPAAKRRSANNGASDSLFPELTPEVVQEDTAVAVLEAEPEPTPSAPVEDPIESIGHTAGRIWHYLDEHGRVAIPQLVRGLNLPRDLILQGLGWLAREDKLEFDEVGRQRFVRLR